MNQKGKNIRLLVTLIILIAISVSVHFWNQPKKKSDHQLVQLNMPDTSAIGKIELISPEFENVIQKQEGGTWFVNNNFEADPGIVQVLLSVISSVEVVRKVADNEIEDLKNSLINNGTKVILKTSTGEVLTEFWTDGKESELQSYIMPQSQNAIYIVEIPGYESYVSGIFKIPTIDWRKRLIVATNWQTLETITYDFTRRPQESFTIKNNTGIPEILNSQQMDSAYVFNLLDQYQYLQADNFLTAEEIINIAGLEKQPPFLQVTVNMREKEPVVINFYDDTNNSAFWVAHINNNAWVRFSKKRLRSLILPKSMLTGKRP